MGMVRNHDDILVVGGGTIHEAGGARRMPEWEKQQTLKHQQFHPRMAQGGLAGESMHAKVMTDEQLELLRRQIAAYAILSQQLVEMYRVFSVQQELAGTRSENIYREALMTSDNKIGARQRWCPSPMQRDILERLFKSGNVTPSRQTIKDITADFSQHGPITETNIYTWFQNQRARSKSKPVVGAKRGKSEKVGTEVESAKSKKMKREKSSAKTQNVYAVNSESSSEIQCLGGKVEDIFSCDHGSRSSDNMGEQSLYDGFSSNQGMDQLINKEDPESLSLYMLGEEFGIVM